MFSKIKLPHIIILLVPQILFIFLFIAKNTFWSDNNHFTGMNVEKFYFVNYAIFCLFALPLLGSLFCSQKATKIISEKSDSKLIVDLLSDYKSILSITAIQCLLSILVALLISRDSFLLNIKLSVVYSLLSAFAFIPYFIILNFLSRRKLKQKTMLLAQPIIFVVSLIFLFASVGNYQWLNPFLYPYLLVASSMNESLVIPFSELNSYTMMDSFAVMAFIICFSSILFFIVSKSIDNKINTNVLFIEK